MKGVALLLSACVALCLCAVPALSGTFTFEDMKTECDSHPTPYPMGAYTAAAYSCVLANGYGGVCWDNFRALDAPMHAVYCGQSTNGYLNGMVSGEIVAFNARGDAASVMQSTMPITLHSAQLTGAWNDGLIITADGYRGSQCVFSKAIMASAYHPTLVSYEFECVDRIVWTATGGVDAGFGGCGTQFAMDDLTYDLVVPEPSSVLALVCGLGLVRSAIRRRR